jgi:hypothetical protein
MKTKDAIAIMNDENSTDAQLREVESFFKSAGLKGLLATVQGTLRQRTTLNRVAGSVQLQEVLLKCLAMDALLTRNLRVFEAAASAMLLAKCERVIGEYETSHPDDNRIFDIPSCYPPDYRHTGDGAVVHRENQHSAKEAYLVQHPCDCRPDEYSMCAARTCPNSCDWPEDHGDYS